MPDPMDWSDAVEVDPAAVAAQFGHDTGKPTPPKKVSATSMLDRAANLSKDFRDTSLRFQYNAANQASFGLLNEGAKFAERAMTPDTRTAREREYGVLRPATTTEGWRHGPGATAGNIAGFFLGPGMAGSAAGKLATKAAGPIARGAQGVTKSIPYVGKAVEALTSANSLPAGIARGAVEGYTAGALAAPESGDAFDMDSRRETASTFGIGGAAMGGVGATARAIFSPEAGVMTRVNRRLESQRSEMEAAKRVLTEEERIGKVGIEAQTAHQVGSIAEKQARIQSKIDALKEATNRQIAQGSREGAAAIQQVLPQTASAASTHFDELVDAGLAKAGNPTRPAWVLKSRILEMASTPEDGMAAIAKTGLNEVDDAMEVGAREAFDRLKKVRGKYSKSTYSNQQRMADDLIDGALDLYGEGAGDAFSEARAFWKQWAPVRDRAFSTFQPREGNMGLGKGANLLAETGKGKTAQGLKASQIAMLDDDINFLSRLSEETGLPDNQRLVQGLRQMDRVEQRELLTRIKAEAMKSQAETTGSRKMSDFLLQHEAKAQATTDTLKRTHAAANRKSIVVDTPLKIALQGIPSFLLSAVLIRIMRQVAPQNTGQ